MIPVATAPDLPWVTQMPGQECCSCTTSECLLIEMGQVFCVTGLPTPCPDFRRAIQCSCRVPEGYIPDYAARQSLAHQNLVWTGALLEAEWVEIRCVNGDFHKYPVVQLEIKYKGKIHLLRLRLANVWECAHDQQGHDMYVLRGE